MAKRPRRMSTDGRWDAGAASTTGEATELKEPPGAARELAVGSRGPALPAELVAAIAAYVERPAALLLVSRRCYDAALPLVYRRPQLGPHNYSQFVKAVSLERGYGALVRELDLSGIVQTGKNSMTARLLRRCAPNLELFVAPQSHFGIAPLISLRSCRQLRVLDLSLVSETVDLPQLLRAVQGFTALENVHFPRSSIHCECFDFQWPASLRSLSLAGGITPAYLERVPLPANLAALRLSNCPQITGDSLVALLARAGAQLRRLAILYPLPGVLPGDVDAALMLCPHLDSLAVSLDYASSALLDMAPEGHPLKTLTLTSSGAVSSPNRVRPSDVLLATEALAQLSRVRVSIHLGWNPESQVVANLISVLDERGGGLWYL